MDLDSLRLKTVSQLADSEKTFLRENVDKLTEEDKSAYSSFLNVEEEILSEEQQETEGDNAESEKEQEGKDESEAPKGFQFETEEQAKEFVRKNLAETEKARAEALEEARTPEERRLIQDDNWKPKNWDEAAKTFVKIAKDEIKEEQVAATKRSEANAQRLENEWQELRKENKLEDITTKKGREAHDKIVDIALKHGKKTFRDAYALYSIIPVDKGGGYDSVVVQQQQQQDVIASQRKAASKIGGQNPGSPATKSNSPLKAITYEDMHGKPRSRVLKEALSNG